MKFIEREIANRTGKKGDKKEKKLKPQRDGSQTLLAINNIDLTKSDLKRAKLTKVMQAKLGAEVQADDKMGSDLLASVRSPKAPADGNKRRLFRHTKNHSVAAPAGQPFQAGHVSFLPNDINETLRRNNILLKHLSSSIMNNQDLARAQL